jgi:hypothetical protein
MQDNFFALAKNPQEVQRNRKTLNMFLSDRFNEEFSTLLCISQTQT